MGALIIAAKEKGLIKGVAKEHFDLDEGQQERIKVVEINDKEKTVTLRYGAKTETLQAGEPITLASQEMQGISIESIEKGKITLSNSREYHTSEQFCPSVYGDSYQENMVRRALHWHFETERQNFEQERKIKTLALFFIDSIRSYRGPNGTNGWLADKFEQLLKEKVESELKTKCSAAYRSYLEATLADLYHSHAGYFAEDQNSSDDEVAAQVKLILHDKKQLLAFKKDDDSWNTCRFVFSKWTLREGWDNPNVFTICKLRSSGSENSKLQEVGRGLRLPVDEYGNRSSDDFTLNYIVDYDDKDFAEKLVDEINGGRKSQTAITDRIPAELIVAVAKKRGITEKALVMDLMANDIIDFNGIVNKDNLHKLYELYPEFEDKGLGNKITNRNKKDKKNIKIRKEKFEELCDKNPSLSDFYKGQNNGFYKCRELNESECKELIAFFKAVGFSALNFTDSRSIYQFYNLSNLWKHIQKALDAGVNKLNIATEPVCIAELYEYLEKKPFVNELRKQPFNQNLRSKHAGVFGGKSGYFFTKDFVMEDIKKYVEEEM